MKRKTITEIEEIVSEQFKKNAISTHYDLKWHEINDLVNEILDKPITPADKIIQAIHVSFLTGFYYGYRCSRNHRKNHIKPIF